MLSVILLFILILLWDNWRNRRIYYLAANIPKVDVITLPIVGDSLTFVGGDEHAMHRIKDIGRKTTKIGGISKIWLGKLLTVVVTDAVVAKMVLRHCLEKTPIVDHIKPLLGNGLLTAKADVWKPKRKKANPSFTNLHVKQLIGVFSKNKQELIKNLDRHENKGDFSLWSCLHPFTMESVFDTNMGIQVEAQKNPNNEFLRSFSESSAAFSDRIFKAWMPDFLYKLTDNYKTFIRSKNVLHQYVRNAISQSMENIKKKSQEGSFTTLLESLMEPTPGLVQYSEEDLVEELLIIAMAGTDTTAVGSCFTLRMLAKYPEAQKRLYKEICEKIGENNHTPTYEQIQSLTYLEAVVKETLRLYPPIPLITRHVKEDLTLQNAKVENIENLIKVLSVSDGQGSFGDFCLHIYIASGITLVPGVDVTLLFECIHRNPTYWGVDADQFRPERFFDDKEAVASAFMPFAFGSRNCIGLNYALLLIKYVVLSLVQRYEILPPLENNLMEKRDPKLPSKFMEDSFRVRFDMMLKDVDNFKIRIQKRV